MELHHEIFSVEFMRIPLQGEKKNPPPGRLASKTHKSIVKSNHTIILAGKGILYSITAVRLSD